MIDKIREEFFFLEKERFLILNDYVLGIVNLDKVLEFGKRIDTIRMDLEKVEITEETLYEIANIKSKVQHFYTEIMEDEELLRVAYSNKM